MEHRYEPEHQWEPGGAWVRVHDPASASSGGCIFGECGCIIRRVRHQLFASKRSKEEEEEVGTDRGFGWASCLGQAILDWMH